MKIAVQLYTLRDLLERDTYSTLRRLSEMGFRTAQLAGTYGKPVKEFASVCKDLGIQIIAPHLGIDEFELRMDGVVDMCQAFGTEMAVLPWIDKKIYADGWKGAASRMNSIGEITAKNGIQFLYHNHSFEFEKEDGLPGYDVLWENADPKSVFCEMDAYWVVHGGGDPATYLKTLKGRVKTMHFKDMSATDARDNEDVGYGILKWGVIIPLAKEVGVQYAIIERDSCTGDPLQHVARSRDFLLDKGLSD